MTENDLHRTSPNCFYLGDVVEVEGYDPAGGGYVFIGRITRIGSGSYFTLENGMGGSVSARPNEVLR